MLIDTHTHLNMDPLYGDWQTVAKQAFTAGITGMVVPGADNESSSRAIEIARQNSRIKAAVGIHPESSAESADSIFPLCHEPEVVAIGEIGLDYFRSPDSVTRQRELFKIQLAMALEFSLPVIVHTRTVAAMSDALVDIRSVYGHHEFRGVFHCFSGSFDFYQTIKTMGAFIGVGGMLTYSGRDELRKVLQQIQLDRILLETDSPWLNPEPRRGKYNTPANVTIVALKLAEIKHVPLSTVLDATSQNALQLFPKLNQIS